MKFLSDEWFDQVEKMRAEAGDLEVPEGLANIIINVNVERDGGDPVKLHLAGGDFERSHSDKAEVTLGLTEELARKLFVDLDYAAGMQAFMAGEIKIEGDMTKLMAMQTTQPSEKQKALLKQIKEITD